MKLTPCGAPPSEILKRLRTICLDLPAVREEAAWAGVRWSIARKNFAHCLVLDRGWPPAYARAASIDSGCVCPFRLNRQQCASPQFRRAPSFRPVWFPNIAGVVIDARVDWDELERLIKESYRVLAPKELAVAVE
jgi:hypothetical protein